MERVTCMAAIAFSISIACSSFNVTTGDGPGLSGGVLVGGKDIGGWHWTISVGAIVNMGVINAFIYVVHTYIRSKKFQKDAWRAGCWEHRR